MGFCWLCLVLAAPLLAASAPEAAQTPLFEPGREYHILTDNGAIATRSFNLFVPRDYADDRAWPVIFRFKGRGEKYNPIICRGGRSNICDRGAIVVGMGYFPEPGGRVAPAEFRTYIARELKSIQQAKRLISKHLRVDEKRLFLSGSSAGGWLTTYLLEYRAQVWAGAMVFVAGRHASADVLTNQASVQAFQDLPVFFGSTLPGASHGENYPWALQAAALYEQRGAVVTFQIYDDDWLVHCPLLRDWNRDFVLTGKNDSIAEKRAKWQKLVREAQIPIDNPRTIRARIAQQLGLQPGQLTDSDLRCVTKLSLMGRRVTDASYLANLPNLQSLDLSFTYIESVEPLLACQHLRTLDISDTHVEDLTPLQALPHLKTLRLWNLWLDRQHIDHLQATLPNLKIIDYQWHLYEKDPLGRVLPQRKVKLN